MSTVKNEHKTTQVISTGEKQMKKLIISVCTVLILVSVLAIPSMAAEDETWSTASVDVNEFVSISLSGSLDFGSVTPPIIQEDGDLTQTDGNPAITITIEPETNVLVDVGIMGALTGGTTLALSNWFYSTLVNKTDITALTGLFVEVYADKAANDTCDFYHWITVPDGTASGSHTANVSYKAVTADSGF
jgi:hypothetical protein